MAGIQVTYSVTIDNETFTAAAQHQDRETARVLFDHIKKAVQEQVELATEAHKQAAIESLAKDQDWFCAKPPHTEVEQQNRQEHGMEEYE